MTTPTPNLKLYFLQASRSIRIAWLLEELNLPYEGIFFPRVNNKAPADFKERSGSSLGKAPVLKDVLKDGEVTILESGGITEYLIEKYDKEQKMMGGKEGEKREYIRGFIHAAEGTFMVHALAVLYARWFCPERVKENGGLGELERGLGVNVGKDLDWLDSELEGKIFIAGDAVTATDTMCLFGVQFIFARDLAVGRRIVEWKNIEGWVKRCEGTESWKRAVEKTGHKL